MDFLKEYYESLKKIGNRTEIEEKLFGFLEDIDKLEDCINAFKKQRRSISALYDLKELRKHLQNSIDAINELLGSDNTAKPNNKDFIPLNCENCSRPGIFYKTKTNQYYCWSCGYYYMQWKKLPKIF